MSEREREKGERKRESAQSIFDDAVKGTIEQYFRVICRPAGRPAGGGGGGGGGGPQQGVLVWTSMAKTFDGAGRLTKVCVCVCARACARVVVCVRAYVCVCVHSRARNG